MNSRHDRRVMYNMMVVLRAFHQWVLRGGIGVDHERDGEGEFKAEEITREKVLLPLQGSKSR